MSNITIQKTRSVILVIRQTEADYKRLAKAARRMKTKNATLASTIISQWLKENEQAKS